MPRALDVPYFNTTLAPASHPERLSYPPKKLFLSHPPHKKSTRYSGRMRWFVLLCLLLVIHFPHNVDSFRQKTAILKSMCKTDESSSVLRELKEKIAKQSKEIESLKKQLKGGDKSGASHGGAHGGGPEMQTEEYLGSPFYKIASHRVGWLSLFLCSLSLTALIMNGFENTLHRQLELAYFVP